MKKVLALVVALAMVLPSASFAGERSEEVEIGSTVSASGLAGVLWMAANLAGSAAMGATAVVGSPVIGGALVAGGTAAASYGLYKGGQALWRWMKD